MQPCCGARAVFEFVGREPHRANLSWTARRRRSSTDARWSAVVLAVSAGSAEETSSNATTLLLGVGAVLVRTQRRIIAPLLKPAVSSQLATPGSRPLNTTRTRPSESTTAWCAFRLDWWRP